MMCLRTIALTLVLSVIVTSGQNGTDKAQVVKDAKIETTTQKPSLSSNPLTTTTSPVTIKNETSEQKPKGSTNENSKANVTKPSEQVSTVKIDPMITFTTEHPKPSEKNEQIKNLNVTNDVSNLEKSLKNPNTTVTMVESKETPKNVTENPNTTIAKVENKETPKNVTENQLKSKSEHNHDHNNGTNEKSGSNIPKFHTDVQPLFIRIYENSTFCITNNMNKTLNYFYTTFDNKSVSLNETKDNSTCIPLVPLHFHGKNDKNETLYGINEVIFDVLKYNVSSSDHNDTEAEIKFVSKVSENNNSSIQYSIVENRIDNNTVISYGPIIVILNNAPHLNITSTWTSDTNKPDSNSNKYFIVIGIITCGVILIVVFVVLYKYKKFNVSRSELP